MDIVKTGDLYIELDMSDGHPGRVHRYLGKSAVAALCRMQGVHGRAATDEERRRIEAIRARMGLDPGTVR